MDRRQRLQLKLYGSAVVLGILAGCTTIPDGRPGHVSDSLGSAFVDCEAEFRVPTRGPDPVPAPEVPETSLASTSPEISGVSREFRLSADTGWLVLPLPRISDDLPLQDPPGSSDALSGLPLIHPTLPPAPIAQRVAAIGTVPAVETATENEVIGDVDGPSVGGVVVDSPPARDVTAFVELGPLVGAAVVEPPFVPGSVPFVVAGPSAGVEVAREVGIADAAVSVAGVPGLIELRATEIPASDTDWLQRRTTADPGSDVMIVLPGNGWLYVGREYGVGIADLIAKRNVAGDDEFVFQFSESGDYGLWFQRQDPSTGQITNERLQVDATPGGSDQISVVSLAEAPAVAVDAGVADGAPGPLAPAAGLATEQVPVLGGVPDAVVGTPGEATVDDPTQWRETAIAASRSGNMPVAVEYWQKVIAAGGADAGMARERLFDLAVGQTAPVDAGVLEMAVDALRIAGELDQERLLNAAETADVGGHFVAAIAYYGELTELSSRMDGLDGIYFRLAQILEKPGPSRDLRRARSLYQSVTEEYPLSRYWDESAAQIEYLNRHYFEIR